MTVLRDLALILLCVEAFLLALAPTLVFGALIYGLWFLHRHENLPSWLRLARAYVDLGQAYVEVAMAAVAKPVLAVNATLAKIKRWLDAIAKLGGHT